MKKHAKIFWWLTAFSISMGFLETSVVVDLRELLYPNGFNFPLTPITPRIGVIAPSSPTMKAMMKGVIIRESYVWCLIVHNLKGHSE